MIDVAVCYSGGLDSYVALHYAQQLQLRPVPVFVNVGQPYLDAELAAIEAQHVDAVVVQAAVYTADSMVAQVLPGRNSLLSLVGALYAPQVWVCAVESEMHPYANRDKSAEWYHLQSALLSYVFRPVRPETTVVSPFASMSKRDVVQLGLSMGLNLSLAHSCYVAPAGQLPCGECKACVHRWIGASLAGLHEQHAAEPWQSETFAGELAMARAAVAADDFSYYTRTRCVDTIEAARRAAARNE